MRYLIFILMLASFAFSQAPPIEPGVSQTLAKWRAVHYSNIRYKLNLTLEKMSPVLKGTVEIRLQQAAVACAAPDCPPMYIVLDWRKIAGHEKDSTISNVSLNGTLVQSSSFSLSSSPSGEEHDKSRTPKYEESKEHLIFREGVVMGENVIKLDFTSPILTSGSAITRYVDKEDGAEYIYSLFVPSDASTAFPVFDQPDLKAKFSLNVLAPEDWKVVANTESNQVDYYDYAGIPNGPTPKSIRGHGYAETQPISTYVFAFAAGPFSQYSYQYGDMMKSADETYFKRPPSPNAFAMNVFVRKSQAKKFEPHRAEVFRLTREGIKFLETYFAYKFPFPKYDIVLIPEFPFGGMEHAGATFLRESSVIFPTEPTANDYISRANVIFHETAHQWFGDTVTMKWFDDLWLKEGFAEFMAYKTLEKVMPQYNAWKVFYERNKQAAYLTDSTKGTTAIYQPIDNLSSAKSAYGNIVYRKAPSFLKQAEFLFGEDKFQLAVRRFLKKHAFSNAEWSDLVGEFQSASGYDLIYWGKDWVTKRGVAIIRKNGVMLTQENSVGEQTGWSQRFQVYSFEKNPNPKYKDFSSTQPVLLDKFKQSTNLPANPTFTLLNYGDYGYGIFLLDDKSRDYILKNIQNEKDDFLRTMMWGSLWDSVREAELDPEDYVELVIKNIHSSTVQSLSVQSSNFSLSLPRKRPTKVGTLNKEQAKACTLKCGEQDESTIQTLLGRVSTAMNYYLSDKQRAAITPRLEAVLLDRMQHAATGGQRITFYRAFLSTASTEHARTELKQLLSRSVPPGVVAGGAGQRPSAALQAGSPRSDAIPLKAKDRFDIVTRLSVLGDPDAPKLLTDLEKTETGADAKRYAYAAHAGFPTVENKARYWNDFLTNKDISESWIEAAMVPFNSIRHTTLTQQYLERALAELPNLKRSRKIFFVGGWLGAFIGGQRDEKALAIVNKFLADNPRLDNDLRLKILENVDTIERAVKIRNKFKAN